MKFLKQLLYVGLFVIGGCGGNDGSTTTQMGGSIQGRTLLLNGAVTTLAGTAGNLGASNGTGASASFLQIGGVTTDGQSIFVADKLNAVIRKIDITTGLVTTLAGTVGPSTGSTDGIGATARFLTPFDVTTDGANLYVTDWAGTIRKIVISTGDVTTLAGTAGSYGSSDGIGAAARFQSPGPMGITTDGTNLFVTDGNAIRKIVISNGAVTTIAGSVGALGLSDGIGAAAGFSVPGAITTDGTNLFVADVGNRTIRKIKISTGEVTTLAGTAGIIGPADGIGPAARFQLPVGITTDGANLYVNDLNANGLGVTIRKISIATGTVSSLSVTSGLADAIPAEVIVNLGITTDGNNLYTSDLSSSKICKLQ